MKIIPETLRARYIRYLRVYFTGSTVCLEN